MSQVLLTMAVANAPTWNIIGIKEAIIMDLEQKYGDVKLLRIEVQEPEQLSFGSIAPSRPARPAYEPAVQPQAGQASTRPSRPKSQPLASCYTCDHYRPGQGWDERGTLYWGRCGNSGRPVYRLIDQCDAWREMR